MLIRIEFVQSTSLKKILNMCHQIGVKFEKSLKTVRLKPSAVPGIFPSLPAYLTTPKPTSRASTAMASCRRELQNSRIEEQNAMILEQDNVSDIISLRSKLADTMLLSHFVMVDKSSGLLFLYFSDDDAIVNLEYFHQCL